MTRTVREKRRLQFRKMLEDRGLTREQAAELLHVSLDTMKSWLKPETTASSNPVPQWAVELLGYKVPVLGQSAAKPATARKASAKKKKRSA
jgi:orotate phosphoribosyltransferase-like protein